MVFAGALKAWRQVATGQIPRSPAGDDGTQCWLAFCEGSSLVDYERVNLAEISNASAFG